MLIPRRTEEQKTSRVKWEKDTYWGRRPRPLSITAIAITRRARAKERAWGSQRADSTEPCGAGAVHRLR